VRRTDVASGVAATTGQSGDKKAEGPPRATPGLAATRGSPARVVVERDRPAGANEDKRYRPISSPNALQEYLASALVLPVPAARTVQR
jgi:hypothetical protein